MKTVNWIIFCLIICWSCNSQSAKPIVIIHDDSLGYYPPTPVQLDQQEFRHYFKILSNYFDSTLVRHGFNGSILVAKEGNIIYEKYCGFGDLRKKNAMTDSTALHIASAGKTFTGMAILRMVQDGQLSLNDSLGKFFPKFPYPGVTIQMLLSHRSGLPNYVYFVPSSKWDKKKYVTNADVLNILYTEKPPRSFKPGTRFTYSNTNYVLLALIIEKLSGKTFPEFMRTRFFLPLGMKDTYVFTMDDSMKAIPSFTAYGTCWQYDCLEGTYGDKNIYTTPRDLLKWDQAFYTDQLIRRSLLDTAFTPYSLERPSIHNYGLGWRLLMIPNGKKVIYHNGRWHGFNAAFARLTDEKITIIVLGNKYNSHIYTAARDSYDLFGDYRQTHDRDEEENDSVDPAPRKTPTKAKRKVRNKR